jgi:predicted enzyme related to lactoylglutathione lyase
MARAIGIGGIFLKARDPKTLGAWYRDHLGLPLEDWGGAVLQFKDDPTPRDKGYAVWSLFPESTKNFSGPYMVNFRVDDLDALLAQLRAAGCAVDEKTSDDDYGRFGWVTDPEGNRVELWQPKL